MEERKTSGKLWIPGLMLIVGLSGCAVAPTSDVGGGNSDTNGGDASRKLAVFQDPDSAFSTSDVFDVDDEIVQFDTDNDSIVWAADGVEYQVGQWVVSGNFPTASQFFQVRFGTMDGTRRAYFTETGPATICDIRTTGGSLSISATSVPVPQE